MSIQYYNKALKDSCVVSAQPSYVKRWSARKKLKEKGGKRKDTIGKHTNASLISRQSDEFIGILRKH